MSLSVRVLPPVHPAPQSVALPTFGCKVNTFETELIAQTLGERDYVRVQAADTADVYIINTCTVTAEADRQARQQVRKVVRGNPQAQVVVTGCYAQMDPQACASIPGVDLVVGNAQKLNIPDLLSRLKAGDLPPVLGTEIDRDISLPEGLLSGYEGRSRAFVQIQQGCDQGCTFCVIHTARGPNRSFLPAMIKRQVERLVMNGYREIVLCGVDIGSYGMDFSETAIDLTDLLGQLVEIEGSYRLRLSSIDPAHITDRLIRFMAGNHTVICPQLHLSMQSGNTLILKRMKRRATREVLYERIGKLRSVIPDLVLSADILVGFPTETEHHFAETVQAIHDLEIAYPHVFPYSSRPGTPAARIPAQIPHCVRKQRAREARKAGKTVWGKVASRQVGKIKRVLIESGRKRDDDGRRYGRADDYFPVKFPSRCHFGDRWVESEITGVDKDALIARIVTQEV